MNIEPNPSILKSHDKSLVLADHYCNLARREGRALFALTIMLRPKRGHKLIASNEISSDIEHFFYGVRKFSYRKGRKQPVEGPLMHLFYEDGTGAQTTKGMSGNHAGHYHGIIMSSLPELSRGTIEDILRKLADEARKGSGPIANVKVEPLSTKRSEVRKWLNYCHKNRHRRNAEELDLKDIILPGVDSFDDQVPDRNPNRSRQRERDASGKSSVSRLTRKLDMKNELPLSRSDVAKLLNISLSKFDAFRKAEEGPAGTKVGRELRFSVEDVLLWRERLDRVAVSESKSTHQLKSGRSGAPRKKNRGYPRPSKIKKKRAA